jgi:coenzyme F420-0:L-glutamate ligase / coenzyme F420-1:gamma-L-glutamate ligase
MGVISKNETTSIPAGVRRDLHLIALSGVPMVREGDDLCELILAAVTHSGEQLRNGDVLVLAQKIVSKARGRSVDLRTVTPSARAHELARTVDKDARLIELILRESSEVLRVRKGVIIVAHRLGFVMANAGIDFSNIDHPGVDGDPHACRALLLPQDPDAECKKIRHELKERTGIDTGIVMNDSHGRAWRKGTVGVAIGASGVEALADMRGKPDLYGRALRVTEIGIADEIAAAASLLMGQSDEGFPAVLMRGLQTGDGRAADLIRPRAIDLFR